MYHLARNAIATSLAAAVAVAIASGCGPTCPSQPTGCSVATTVLVPLPSEAPKVYDLALTFRAGDTVETDRCLAILPPPDDWTANLPVSCLRNSASVYVERNLSIDCSASYPEGASCTADSRGFVLSIRRAGRVDDLTLQLSQDSATFNPVTWEPTYESFYPDGPTCPGACDVASAVVSFESLVEPMPP